MSDTADTTDKKIRTRRFPPLGIWLLDFICLGLVAWLRITEKPDPAIANILTLILSFIALVATLFWFAFLSSYSPATRMSPLVGAIAIGIVLASVFRIGQVDGNMIPRFEFRWKPAHHTTLASLPATAAADAAVEPAPTPESPVPSGQSPPGGRDFPQFLGPDRNSRLTGIRLARDWTARPPKRLWRQPIGDGWSAFSVVGGLAVTMEQRGDDEYVSCYDLLSGNVVWAQPNRALHAEALGGVGPRATPTIDNGRVYTVGATGFVQCLNLVNGKRRWKQELYELAGLSQTDDEVGVAWGRANSPLVVDDRVIVPVGGKSGGKMISLAAFDASSGALLWQAGERQISYSSPSVATFDGVRQIVSVNENSVAGHDIESGAVLWEFEWEGNSSRNATASQTVAIDDHRLFVSKGYGVGAAMYRIAAKGGGWSVNNLWQSNRVLKTKFSNVAVLDRHAYGLSEDTLECVDLENGERVWRGDKYGKGQLLLVDDLLLIQSEAGEIALVEANPEAPHELARFTALDGVCWNNICLAGKYLLIRNAREAACYELPLAAE